MRNVLIVGGAGYIGAHMVQCLTRAGHRPQVLDDLSSGHREAVGDVPFTQGNLGDAALLDRLFAAQHFDAVMHFASFIQVGESVRDPAKYYANNVANTLTLLDAVVRHNIPCFLFSSTAAVYGEPRAPEAIPETHPTLPINPYGRSKLMIEEVMADYAAAYKLNYGTLRYFNAAGAAPDGSIGECHEPETHLIPLVLRAASGRAADIAVFGEDYPTPDGTCIRDYIHVCDLADAHLKLMDYLLAGGTERVFNLGTGRGYSVREVIETARTVTGKPIPVRNERRRPGDPPVLLADGRKAQRILGWRPARSDLATMIGDAWQWENRG